ncbi:MAG: CRISPR-associated RAMP protein Csx7 [Chloroflexota bacterium]|nr:CRISPR-associated RAMP protein Csx7 [Chloroflexota bacterium]
MLKALVNEARLQLEITTSGPLLVKAGYATVIGADMAPVETYRNGRKEVYLPGSSLKGIFRSHSEKVINSIKPQVACNPFQGANDAGDNLYRRFCGAQFNNRDLSHDVYAGSCPTCRIFGSTEFAGRLAIQDAYLLEDDTTRSLIEHRDGVGIDRLTGGAKPGAKFDMETVTAGTTFSTLLHLRNFEIWQLGLLFVIIQDMEDELIRIGSGRSRGLGKVTARISEREEGSHRGGVVLSTIRTGQESREPEHELWGLGPWLANEAALYDTRREDVLTLSPAMPHTPHGIRNLRVFKGAALDNLREQCIEDFVTRIQEWINAQPAPTATRQRG